MNTLQKKFRIVAIVGFLLFITSSYSWYNKTSEWIQEEPTGSLLRKAIGDSRIAKYDAIDESLKELDSMEIKIINRTFPDTVLAKNKDIFRHGNKLNWLGIIGLITWFGGVYFLGIFKDN